MSDLKVRLNYTAAASLIKGLRGWLDRLEVMLDEAAKDGAVPVPPSTEPEGGRDVHEHDQGCWP